MRLAMALLTVPTIITAYSDGAGGSCPAGEPAVGEEHTNPTVWGEARPITQVSFADAGLTFSINDFDPTSTTEPIEIRHQGDYKFEIRATEGKAFKGALIRVEQEQQTESQLMTFLPGSNTHTALACAGGAAGVTHTNSMEKSEVSGFFRTSATSNVQIDVTVVLYNNSTGSVYAYESFDIGVIASHLTDSPTAVPLPDVATSMDHDTSDGGDALGFGAKSASTSAHNMFVFVGGSFLAAILQMR